jgi:hypothetical protein
MAFDTYSGLKTEIANWTHRADLGSQVDNFIDMAEAEMNTKLRLMEQETRTTLAVSSEFTELPTDFLELRTINIADSPDKRLEYKAPAAMVGLYAASGIPKFYSLIGGSSSILQASPIPGGSYTFDITYFAKITALSDSNTSNFILTGYPFCYLFGCMKYAALYEHDYAAANDWDSKFQISLAEITNKDKRRRWSAPSMVITVDGNTA